MIKNNYDSKNIRNLFFGFEVDGEKIHKLGCELSERTTKLVLSLINENKEKSSDNCFLIKVVSKESSSSVIDYLFSEERLNDDDFLLDKISLEINEEANKELDNLMEKKFTETEEKLRQKLKRIEATKDLDFKCVWNPKNVSLEIDNDDSDKFFSFLKFMKKNKKTDISKFEYNYLIDLCFNTIQEVDVKDSLFLSLIFYEVIVSCDDDKKKLLTIQIISKLEKKYGSRKISDSFAYEQKFLEMKESIHPWNGSRINDRKGYKNSFKKFIDVLLKCPDFLVDFSQHSYVINFYNSLSYLSKESKQVFGSFCKLMEKYSLSEMYFDVFDSLVHKIVANHKECEEILCALFHRAQKKEQFFLQWKLLSFACENINKLSLGKIPKVRENDVYPSIEMEKWALLTTAKKMNDLGAEPKFFKAGTENGELILCLKLSRCLRSKDEIYELANLIEKYGLKGFDVTDEVGKKLCQFILSIKKEISERNRKILSPLLEVFGFTFKQPIKNESNFKIPENWSKDIRFI